MAHVIHLRMFDMLLRVDLFFEFSQLYRKMNKALKILHNFTDSVIVERREQLLRKAGSNSEPTADSDNVGEKKKLAFLDILLQSEIEGKPLSNLDIREEVDTFMFEVEKTRNKKKTFSNIFILGSRYDDIGHNLQSLLHRQVSDRPAKVRRRDRATAGQRHEATHNTTGPLRNALP